MAVIADILPLLSKSNSKVAGAAFPRFMEAPSGRLGQRREADRMVTTPQAKRNRLMLVGIAVLAVAGLLVLARGALFPFVLSGGLAYLLHPVVRRLEAWLPLRRRWPTAGRIVAVSLIYLAALAAAGGALALAAPPAIRQGTELVESLPEVYSGGRATLERWSGEYADSIPADVRERVEETLGSGGSILIRAGQSIVARTVGGVVNAFTTVIGLAIVPLFLFYLLKDRVAAVGGLYSLLPPAGQRHMRNMMDITNQVLGSYVRAQVTLAVVVAILVSLGLFALGVRYSLLLGGIAGLFEFVPVVGPLLGAIPGLVVVLATAPERLIWVVLLYVAVQVMQNVLLVPRIQGRAVNVHPAIIMIVIVVGSEVAGIWGVILAVPATALLRDIFKYFHGEWSVASPGPDGKEATARVDTVPEAPSPADGPDDSPAAR